MIDQARIDRAARAIYEVTGGSIKFGTSRRSRTTVSAQAVAVAALAAAEEPLCAAASEVVTACETYFAMFALGTPAQSKRATAAINAALERLRAELGEEAAA